MMTRLLLMVAMVLGCNTPTFYGPENPPPDPSPNARFRFQYLETRDADQVAVATCLDGSVIVGASCDCVWCEPPAGTYPLFGCQIFGNSAVGGCHAGCARAVATCVSTDRQGTLAQGVTTKDEVAEAFADDWRTRLGLR